MASCRPGDIQRMTGRLIRDNKHASDSWFEKTVNVVGRSREFGSDVG